MKRLENLPEIADDMLGGLHASQALKEDILRDAQLEMQGQKVRRNTPWQKKKGSARRPALRAAAAFACMALVITGVLLAPGVKSRQEQKKALIDTQIAGEGTVLSGGQSIALDMPRGSVVISQRSQPGYRGIWEPAQDANFPLVCVDGRYYRMMSNPTALGSSLQGEALGRVDTFTSEPALASGGIVSNIVPQDETVSGSAKGASGKQPRPPSQLEVRGKNSNFRIPL